MSRGRDIIDDALARACFDAPQMIFDDLRKTVFDPGLRPCDGKVELARRVVAELQHAGYFLLRGRHTKPGASAMKRRLELEDHVHFGILWTDQHWRQHLGDERRSVAGEARAEVARNIRETFEMMRVVLGYRRPPALEE